MLYSLADLLDALIGKRLNASRMLIADAVIDSRQVIPSALFIAIPGEQVDGHDYLSQSFSRGALAALIEKDVAGEFPTIDLRNSIPDDFTLPEPPFCLRVDNTLIALQQAASFWRSQLAVDVVGITGSVGKSTTKELVAEVLSRRFSTIKNLGNYNNEIGLPLTMLRMTRATQVAILEMGFYIPGEIKFLCDIAQPRVGIVTNVGTVHAERAGSQENIARGKAELVESLPSSPEGIAILNRDDPWVCWMEDKTRATVLTYSQQSEAHITARDIIGLGLDGIEFTLRYGQRSHRLHVPLIGKHSVLTVLRAAAAGFAFNLTWEEIIDGLQTSTAQLRLSAVQSSHGAMILDDTYNAAPESTMAALDLLFEIPGRRIAVLGDMLELGPYEKTGHEWVGARAAKVADQLIAVGPRARMIAESALAAGMPVTAVACVDAVPQAIDVLKSILGEGDVVLIKGSHGLRMDRIVREIEATG
ncbi:MAG: UDP-N-acetylmuramoyl-tripeptide--D-alanyl-D-alanine ligase [Leptolinea sp.]